MKSHKFKPVSPQVNFPTLEEETLKYWEKNNIFKKSVDNRKGKKPYVFYEGPPTANGKPGSHHVEARVFKDLMPRFKTMQGFYSDRKGGWDCHGLPVELEVEKKLGISGKPQIEEYGVEKFNKLCRESVFEYVDEWQKLTRRIGFWIDMENAYETMDNSFIESGWWILKQVWEKGWLYEDYKVVPYCSRCGTSLSSHELALGYKDDVADVSVYVKFKLKGKDNTYFLAWTTTPWTLPGNVGLAVKPDKEYVEVKVEEEKYILARERLAILPENREIVSEFKGEELVGKEYEPLYNFIEYDKKAHFVVPADFVSMDEGTGIVHTAVMYGEDDFELGKKFDLPKKHAVNEKGEFVKEVTPWAGMFVKKADPLIIEDLDAKKLLFKKEEIKHTYPFCWRCGTPLLYYALTSWYLKTTAVKDKLIANNDSVNWTPEHIKNGRMGEWLRNNKDWALSRSRYWGSPLPIWRCKSCQHTVLVGSVEELSKLSGKNQSKLDLHRPYIDAVSWDCEKCSGGKMERLPFVLDCWFDSGSMPFAQWHFPFENKDKFETHFPADYICEAMDQTRGWFYTLQAVSTLLGHESPYKNVICLGLALDEKGNKMSKSKGNVVSPWDVISEAGVDAMRWYFYSVVSPGESFRFSTNLVKEVNRRFLLILWNVYSFFVLYSNMDSWTKGKAKSVSANVLDEWILSKLNKLVEQVTSKLENYDIYGSTSDIEKFVSDLSTWYVRRSRDRVGPSGTDKEAFYETMYEVLTTLSKLLAPFMPFVSEEIYRNLTGEVSIHLTDWPKPQGKVDEKLEEEMQLARQLVELSHADRKTSQIKVRQPLSLLEITVPVELRQGVLDLIKDEVNVKKVIQKKGDLEINLVKELTPELIAEGEAREIVRAIQDARKEMKTAMDEYVEVTLPSWPEEFEDYIKKQTLTKNLKKGDALKVTKMG